MLGPGQTFPEYPNAASKPFDDGERKTKSWRLILFLDRTLGPIGAVELAYLKDLGEEFATRNIKSFGVVADPSFLEFYRDQYREQDEKLPVEIVDDSGGDLCQAVGVSTSQRASFLVDSGNVIRYACSYEAAYPRNMFSILAVFDSIHVGQLHPALRGLSPIYGSKPC
jgi:alkyl hydroperoxide reductase subunit AhpC